MSPADPPAPPVPPGREEPRLEPLSTMAPARRPVVLLDVSDLPPPAPLERAVEALDALAAGAVLHLVHRREPCLLFPILDERGLLHLTRTVVDGEVHVVAWPAGDAVAEAAARAALPEGLAGPVSPGSPVRSR